MIALTIAKAMLWWTLASVLVCSMIAINWRRW